MAYKIEYRKRFEREDSYKDWFSEDYKDEYFTDRTSAVERIQQYVAEKSYFTFYDPIVIEKGGGWRARIIKQ
jgi:hypothetical protein